MYQRTAIYVRSDLDQTGTTRELVGHLRQAIESRGDLLVATYSDDARLTGKGKNGSWRRLLADLDTVQQIVLADPGDLPGRTIGDLLNILAILTAHGVTVAVPTLGIDTGADPAAFLDLIGAYRRAKRSQAIRQGQVKSSKRNGRPPIPAGIQRQIVVALSENGGIRPTARRFNVSPASVINVRRSMCASAEWRAA